MTVASRVRDFHERFGHPVATTPQALEPARADLRVNLIKEEVQELLLRRDDPLEVVDALADIVYVCYGMAVEMGVDLDAVVGVVHDANMAKLGEDGKPIYREDGKILKPEGWTPPDIAGELDRQRQQSYRTSFHFPENGKLEEGESAEEISN